MATGKANDPLVENRHAGRPAPVVFREPVRKHLLQGRPRGVVRSSEGRRSLLVVPETLEGTVSKEELFRMLVLQEFWRSPAGRPLQARELAHHPTFSSRPHVRRRPDQFAVMPIFCGRNG
jgi:hypothetical protein